MSIVIFFFFYVGLQSVLLDSKQQFSKRPKWRMKWRNLLLKRPRGGPGHALRGHMGRSRRCGAGKGHAAGRGHMLL